MKTRATLISCFLLILLTALNVQAQVPSAPALGAKGYLLVDHESGRVLASKAATERMEPASITKLMTAYVVFQAIRNGQIGLKDEVLVSEKAWRTEGSRMFIEVGKRVPVDLLLQGMIIQSGNDASVALAEHVAGTEETFAELMNQTAFNLGMLSSHYMNSTGLPDDEHYTTASDIAILANAIIRDFPEYYEWYSVKQFTYNGITQDNRNALLWRDSSVDGLKTGHTEAAGYCLVSSAKRENTRLVAVILGTNSTSARANDSQALLNYGFRFFETRLLYQAGQAITDERVWYGDPENTTLISREDIYVTIPRGSYDRLQARTQIDGPLEAPLGTDGPAGQLKISLDGELIDEIDLYSKQDIPEAGLIGQFIDWIMLWFE